MARPFAAPPGIPADRKAALIAAFERTMQDPDFLAEAQRSSIMDVNPLSARRRSTTLLAEALRHAEGRRRKGRARRCADMSPIAARRGAIDDMAD